MVLPDEFVKTLVRQKNGRDPSFFAEKTLTNSDTADQQNRLLFHKEDVINFIFPVLGEAEKEKANLQFDKNGMSPIEDNLHGLPVELYTKNGWMFPVFLRRRESKGFVLKGKDWKKALVFGQLREGDHVQLWSLIQKNP